MSTPIIVDVQSKSGNAASVALSAFAANPSNGDTIVVSYVTFATGTHLAPTDNYGNTYTQIGSQFNPGTQPPYMSLWYAHNIVGGPAFVVTVRPNVTFYACEVWCLTNVDPNPYNGDFVSNPYTSGVAAAPTTGPSSPSPTANSIFLAFCSPQQMSPAATDPTGWNTTGSNGFTAAMLTRARVNDYTANENNFGAYKIASAVQTATWGNTYTLWGAMMASFAPLAAPVATSISPGQGTVLGGTPVTITGTNFNGVTGVDFDGTPATGVVVVNSTTITCVTPAHALGQAVVTVTQPSGSSSLLANQWEYKLAPTPTNITPQYGSTLGGSMATITGSNFVNGATVDFGGTPATDVVVVDANTITCTIPAHMVGAIVVTVTNP